MGTDPQEEGLFEGLTEDNWWETATGTVFREPITHEVRVHPPEKGKPGPLTYIPVVAGSGGLFTKSDLHYYIDGKDDKGEPCWAVRGRHGHPRGGKLEYFLAALGTVHVELHSVIGCRVVQLTGQNKTMPVAAGVWHAVWIPPNSRLEVIADGESSFDIAFDSLPCDCDRRTFVTTAGLDPNNDPTLRV